METPLYELSEEDLDVVYSPSEDTFLLIDALQSDLEMLQSIKPVMCLEIGSGSGVVITALAMAFRKLDQRPYCLAVDVNPHACRVTKRTAVLNSVDVDLLNTDLLTCVRSGRVFDIVVFNPPYVVTEDEELSSKDVLSRSWCGGSNGRRVMERVFDRIPGILSREGVFYLLVLKENDPEYILRTLEKFSMRGQIVAERRIRGEHLYVLRFKKVSYNCT